MNISVIIPVYQGGEAFRTCIESVMRANPPANEVIIVSDASPDDSDRVAQAAGARLIRLPVNAGPSRARNVGASAASGDILLFIDADVSIPPTLIGQVSAVFASSNGTYSPTSTPDAIFGSYDDAPAAPNFASQYRNLLHYYVHQTSRETATTFWAGCGAIRREVFQKIGGFPEDRRWLEDIELGYRITTAGYSIRLIKSIQVKHLKRWTLRSVLITDFFHRALPWTELLYQYAQSTNDLNLRTSSRMSVILIYLIPVLLAGALLLDSFDSFFVITAIACTILLVLLNSHLMKFFLIKRGFLFMLRAAMWYYLYYIYSSLGYIWGTLRYRLGFIPDASTTHKSLG